MATLGPDEFRRRLARALEVGGNAYGPEDIAAAVGEGRMQSWVRNESLIVTELLQYPKASAVNIVIAVGALDDVMALQPDIEAFGREHGARVMRISVCGWNTNADDVARTVAAARNALSGLR